MSAAAKSVNWTALASKLSPESGAALGAFRRRHLDLQNTLRELQAVDLNIDFARYRASIRNTEAVEMAEKAVSKFKPATYDLKEQLAQIEKHRETAKKEAQETVQKIEAEVKELKEMLKNIQSARPLEQLTVDDVMEAVPSLQKDVQEAVMKSQWWVPGYYEKMGPFKIGF